MSFWLGRIAKFSMPAMMDTRNFGLLWAIQVFLKGLDKFWSILATLGHFKDFGHIGSLLGFGPFGPIWAILGHFAEVALWATLGCLGLSWQFCHFWGLAHFGTFWATFWAPILGFRFGYDQADCVAPVFKKELT